MGGSRCSKTRNYWNIFVTFLVSGIWHGANWTFIVWGVMHGICQIIEKMLGQQKCNYGWFGKTIKIVITFLLVNFAWIFFRMPTLHDACNVIARIFNPALPMNIYMPDSNTTTACILVGLFLLLIKDLMDEFFPSRFKLFDNNSLCVRWGCYFAIIIIIMLMGVLGSDQFIYESTPKTPLFQLPNG